MTISVRILEKEEYSSWDAFMVRSHQGTVFHLSPWIEMMGRVLDRRPTFYGCFADGHLVGGAVLYNYNTKLFFRIGSSFITMSPYGGLVLGDEETGTVRSKEKARFAIINEFIQTISLMPYDYIKVEPPPFFYDIRPFIWNGWGQSVRYTYMVQPDSFKFSKDARQKIRKALSQGIVIESSTDIDKYWSIFNKTFSRQYLPAPLSREQLAAIFETILANDMGEMWAAVTPSGEWAAAEIHLFDNKRSYSWSAASDRELLSTGANQLLLQYVFEHMAERKINEINVFTANTPALSQIMVQFNPVLVPYYRIWKRQRRLKFLNRFHEI